MSTSIEPVIPAAPARRIGVAELRAEVADLYVPGSLEEVPIARLTSATALFAAPPAERIAVLDEIVETLARPRGYDGPSTFTAVHALKAVASRLLRQPLPFTEHDLTKLLGRATGGELRDFPVVALIGAVGRFVPRHGLSPQLRAALDDYRRSAARKTYIDGVRASRARLAALLDGTPDHPALIASPWAAAVAAWLNSLPKTKRSAWTALLSHAASAGAASRPSGRWLASAPGLVRKLRGDFARQMTHWLETFPLERPASDPNADLFKGLIWCIWIAQVDALAPQLGLFCERCFKKQPGFGPRSMKLGNASLAVLSALESGIAELARLKMRIRQPMPLRWIEAALCAIAERAGLSVADLEEIVAPRFGLDAEGRLVKPVGDCAGELSIGKRSAVELRWRGPDGKPRKSLPARVVAAHRSDIRELKRSAKEITASLAAAARRIENFPLIGREWPFEIWRARILEHPILGALARRLIWYIGERSAVPRDGEPLDRTGRALSGISDATPVRLWHPLDAGADEVRSWRERLDSLGIVQPFKQAWREIYVITDAERLTATYSNRFAAHVLRQPQFRALCHQLGWHHALQVFIDNPGPARLRVPSTGLTVEFWVRAREEWLEGAPAPAYLTTDQVRFLDEPGVTVPLEQVPGIVFSEIMRQVDLFVGVGSIANDPNWLDSGDQPNDLTLYCHNHAFGPLATPGEARRELLAVLLPRLSIANSCMIEERFLVVHGHRGTYKIHLGSGNILMAPNDRYLCIVPDRRALRADSAAVLPFEGDDTLAIILSKAFMLAADDRIEDASIVSQIERR